MDNSIFYNVLRYADGKIWRGGRSRRLPYAIQNTALRKLRLLHAAKSFVDLRIPPGNHLEALKAIAKANGASA